MQKSSREKDEHIDKRKTALLKGSDKLIIIEQTALVSRTRKWGNPFWYFVQ